ncbi:MAG: hypothetical protein ACREV2_05685, partial [Burkholderiales bacterium]
LLDPLWPNRHRNADQRRADFVASFPRVSSMNCLADYAKSSFSSETKAFANIPSLQRRLARSLL